MSQIRRIAGIPCAMSIVTNISESATPSDKRMELIEDLGLNLENVIILIMFPNKPKMLTTATKAATNVSKAMALTNLT